MMRSPYKIKILISAINKIIEIEMGVYRKLNSAYRINNNICGNLILRLQFDGKSAKFNSRYQSKLY